MSADHWGENSIARSASMGTSEKSIICSLPRPEGPGQVAVVEIFLWRIRDIDLFQKRRDVFLLEPDIQIGRVIGQRFPLDGNITAEPGLVVKSCLVIFADQGVAACHPTLRHGRAQPWLRTRGS